ncbi:MULTISPECIES: restriction endonuclease subunit S [Bacillaceae]|uniref:Restriction endonuclease subunit S n=1 Tax=Mesobacillus jeotgali TaxID=129985 RepID=A0ABY9VM83_9BACI|nr:MULTISPECIES: restriction endonuclease subunit S [Bacillaceae]REB74301.1 restriction endonuclease subunit S [Cutibacterium acnes]WNF22066.1 restriction endonuclease subunit S [Mesobacillus jeotgali]
MSRPTKDSRIEWIGEIPVHWEVGKVKHLFFRSKEINNENNPKVLSLARSGIKERNISNNEGQLAASYDNYSIVKEGDLLLNPMDLTSGANCNYSFIEGVISPAYINLRSKNECSSKYYDYYFKLQYWSLVFFAHGKGVSFEHRWTLNNETLMNFAIPIPPVEEQVKISNYLDNKVSQVENLIDKTKLSIIELKKYMQSLIIEAVTKGLTPNVEMKETGVEWLGSIPFHWKVSKLKNIFEIKKIIANDLGYDVLSVTQKGLKIKDIQSNEGQLSSDYSKYQIVEINDFVMNHMDLLTGWVDCSKYIGVTSPDYRVFRFKNNIDFNHEYFKYLLQGCYLNKTFYGFGQGVSNHGRWRLPTDEFLNFYFPIPSIEEQNQIVNFLTRKIQKIDELIDSKEELLNEMEQFKRSLIYEYVTGKKEVI